MSAVGDLVATLGCNIAPFQRNLDSAVGVATRSAGAIRSALSSFLPALGGIGSTAWIMSTAEKFVDIEKASHRLGVSIDMFQRMQYAAGKVGIEVELLTKGFSAMVAKVGAGGEKMNEALGQLGLNPAALKAQAPEQTYKQVMEALGGVSNAYERARLASELFGKSGKEIANSIQNINEKMTDASVLTTEAAEGWAKLGSTVKGAGKELSRVSQEIGGRLAAGILPRGQSPLATMLEEGRAATTGSADRMRELSGIINAKQDPLAGVSEEERTRIGKEAWAAGEQLTKMQEKFPGMLEEAGGAAKDQLAPMRELLDQLDKLAAHPVTEKDFASKAAALRTFIDQYDRLAEATREAAESEQEAITRWQTLNSAVVAARTPLEQYAAALKHVDELVNLFGLDSVNAMRMQAKAAAEFDRAKGAPEKLREELSRWQQLQGAAAEVMRKFNPEMDFAHKAEGLRRMFEEGLIDRMTLAKALLDAAGQAFPGPERGGKAAERDRILGTQGPVLAERGTDVAWRTIMDAMRGGGDESEKAAVATAENTARAAQALEDIAGRDPDEGAVGIP